MSCRPCHPQLQATVKRDDVYNDHHADADYGEHVRGEANND